MSPAATQWLYPLPLYGESPNHSPVDLAQPEAARYPLSAHAVQHQLSAHLEVTYSPSLHERMLRPPLCPLSVGPG